MKTTRMFAALTAIASLCSSMGFTAGAADTTKNYEYYLGLSDYEVYCDYCDTYGFTAEASLPDESELPDYENLAGYTTDDFDRSLYAVAVDSLTQSEIEALDDNPDVFGFPTDWTLTDELGTQNLLYTFYTEVNDDASNTDGCIIMLNHDVLSHYVYQDEDFAQSVIDIYRICLTIENSAFVTENASEHDWAGDVKTVYTLPAVKGSSAVVMLGDMNRDGSVDAADAAELLAAAAEIGSGKSVGSLGYYWPAADVNSDGEYNATDAALILQYAAAAGAGSSQTFEEFLENA